MLRIPIFLCENGSDVFGPPGPLQCLSKVEKAAESWGGDGGTWMEEYMEEHLYQMEEHLSKTTVLYWHILFDCTTKTIS